jgi:transposase
VKLAVESEQSIAQTARDLGVNENTLHTWIGKYHRAARQDKQVHDEHLYEELKRLRKENARLKEERAIVKNLLRRVAASLVGGETCPTRVSCPVGGVAVSLLVVGTTPLKNVVQGLLRT